MKNNTLINSVYINQSIKSTLTCDGRVVKWRRHKRPGMYYSIATDRLIVVVHAYTQTPFIIRLVFTK